MYEICSMTYYYLLRCFDSFWDRHQASIARAVRVEQTAKLYKWHHSTLEWMSQILDIMTKCQAYVLLNSYKIELLNNTGCIILAISQLNAQNLLL